MTGAEAGAGLAMHPHRLGANPVPVYYAGGENIARFRGEPAAAAGPEDWVASVSALPPAILPAGAPADSGVTRLPDGTSLRDAIAQDPSAWLGPALAARWGGETGLLVKLLDAGERLPVHCHPSRPFAREHLGSPFGKTEAWIVMDDAPGGDVWLGFRDEVPMARLREWVERQAIEDMLASMNRFAARPGSVFYVPAGTPHAIGPGVMITELQEPTSFSVLAEYRAFGLDADQATLGLGWERAIEAFDRSSYAGDRIERLLPPGRVLVDDADGRVLSLFAEEADEFFEALRIEAHGRRELPRRFSVVIVESGTGMLTTVAGETTLTAGETWVVPYAAGPARLEGQVRVIVCLPSGPA